MAGDLMKGTGGARKLRFARRGQGKSGGYRIVTFFAAADVPVFLLVRDWEQGRTRPDAAIRAFLAVIDREPAAVARALEVSF